MATHSPYDPRLHQKKSKPFLLKPAVCVALLLAFPALAVAQTNFVTPVCDRTPRVRDEIVRLVSTVSDCTDVTEAHLAEIEEALDLRGPQDIFSIPVSDRETRADIISELKAGDFSGLISVLGIDCP